MAHEATKPITIVFALIGLYLFLEKSFSGRQVQKAHRRLAKRGKEWFQPRLPKDRGAIVISDVIAAAPGQPRDAMTRDWCVSVWEAWRETRHQIVELARDDLDID